MKQLPKQVFITEQAPRDGLQDVKEFVPTEKKARLIRMIAESGVRSLSVTSFVSPQWVPQMADAEELLKALGPAPAGVTYSAVVPNGKALERALALPKEIRPGRVGVPASASETFQKKNVNRTVAETIAELKDIAAEARRHGIVVGASVSMAFGCPYEGDIPVSKVVETARKLLETGVDGVSLADTTGTSNPRLTREICEAAVREVPAEKLSLHIHDSRGMGLACVLAALECGITRMDGSVGGIGGCPYAKGARGNIASEDLVHMLHEMGIETGINLDKLIACGKYVRDELKLPTTSQVLESGAVNHKGKAA
ncbi:MAG: hydroxymethylglutaryl-CoA lyase [Bdellovibrionota bacterium]